MTISFGAVRSSVLAVAAGFSAFVSTSVGTAQAASVVELFTSQGCSSCPPADEVLAKLAHEPGIIAVSLPVDYWDYLGWKDTFAKPAFTARQRAYATARHDGQIYTPQAVINGSEHCNGASRSEIARAIAQTGPGVDVPVTLTKTAGGVELSIGAATNRDVMAGSIIVMPVIGQREVAIGRGENARRKVTYTNIVRELVPLGRWTGARTLLTVPAAALADADSIVVILEAAPGTRGPGTIIGAAQLALR